MRWYVHVDMDAYFASVEQRVNPSLQGRPVIVGGRPGSRGVVSTASYEARAFGVRSGMPIGEAVRRCPDGVFLNGNFALYVHTSKCIFEVLRTFSPRVQPASIDEAYLELDTSEDPRVFGPRIQAAIQVAVELSASLGISDTKYLSKIASAFEKPRGLTVLCTADVPARLWPLPSGTLYGVGPKTEARLRALGYVTVGDVANAPEGALERRFGAGGLSLRQRAHGHSHGRVVPPEEAPDVKSIGHERTLEHNVYDHAQLQALLATLAEKVGRRARKHGLAGRRVVVKLRDPKFNTITHGRMLPRPLDADADLSRIARELLAETRFWERGVRLVGLCLEQLVRTDQVQQLAFDFNAPAQRALPALDAIRSKYGETAIGAARAFEAGTRVRRDRISFQMPDVQSLA